MPPTHFEGGNVNMFQPYVVGQSGTDRPDPVLVTRLPARSKRIVEATTTLENRWSMLTWAGRARRAGGAGKNGTSRTFLYAAHRPALPPVPPILPEGLVRRDRWGLDRERNVLGFARANRHALGDRAALLVPGF